ncbi:MAG: inositol monophosphatase family protein [Roseovarius sp.]|nr:inositol monophosphatase family protein [Roseovarius sp.]
MSEGGCPADFVALAHELADAAGPIVRKHFRTRLDIVSKTDDSPVTIADRAAERVMRNLVSASFPDHGIRGEEYGVQNPEADWCWIFDPIDGTKSFMSGSLCFGTQIGLKYRGRPVLGVIDQPITRERWLGIAGQVTTLGNTPVATSDVTEVAQANLYTSAREQFSAAQAGAFDRLASAAAITRYSHDCYAAGLLALGMVDILVEANLFDYDIVPQIPIIQGAGGIVSDWNGEALGDTGQFETVLMAANPDLHAAALDLLRLR